MTQLSLSEAGRRAIELVRTGKHAEAEAVVKQILRVDPGDPTALHCFGCIAQSVGRHVEAVELFRRAITREPSLSEYHYNLSVSLTALGQADKAISPLREAVRLEPGFQLAHANLGGLLLIEGEIDEAEAVLRRAIELNPKEPSAHANLGKLLRDSDRLDEAESEFKTATELAPANPQPWNMLGTCLREMGRVPEAIGAFRNAIHLRHAFREAHSNLCYAVHLDPQVTAKQILAEHQEWGRRFADPAAQALPPHANNRDPDRPLKIGYVSPDFRMHSLAQSMIPLLDHHDRGQVQVYLYSNVLEPDEMTEQLAGFANEWRNINGVNDDEAADMIRADGIDVLVDLTLHMTGNRLGVFARKPAPVQMTWLGYPSTTGVSAIDYRISDPVLDPPGSPTDIYVEKTVRLPHSFWCYRPFEGTPAVNPLPARRNGVVTFGCFNSFAMVNDVTLDRWTRVLGRVAGSRLLLQAPGGSARMRISKRLADGGVELGRFKFVDPQPQQDMELFHRVDVCLDTFPFTGHTTTLDATWMGVPVVTMTGPTAVSRGSASILRTVGVGEFVASNQEEFVGIATGLAEDVARLAELRETLRPRMLNSALMNDVEFAQSRRAVSGSLAEVVREIMDVP